MLRLAWAGACGLALAITPVLAHAPTASAVRTTLNPLPETLAALRVQLHETLAAQLVIENPTGTALEILDAQGRSFLRIGPDGVRADMAALAWYQSFVPGGVPAPLAIADGAAKPRWVQVRHASSWGWFDPRLRAEQIQLTDAQRKAVESKTLGVWRIPVRYGDVHTELSGEFVYEPPLPGGFESRLTSAPELTPGLRVRLVPGAPPALLLENNSARSVTVIGAGGEPMLRFKQDRIYANLRSPSWRASGRSFNTASAQAEAATSEVLWTLVGRATRYSWLEPRAGSPQRRPSGEVMRAGQRRELHRWKIPVLIDQQPVSIEGVVEWVPAPSRKEQDAH
ncbi:MAG: hypothetical protein ACRETN_08445 [Nevskiales bacterium]